MVIRELKMEEFKMASDLYCECFNKEKKDVTLPLMGNVIGLFLDNRLIGMAQIDFINNIFEDEKIYYINSFCIKDGYRHKGYGTALLDWCINFIKLSGGTMINMTSNKNRVYAHMLYKKMGFEVVDTVLLKKDI